MFGERLCQLFFLNSLLFNLHFPINFTPFQPSFLDNFIPFPTYIFLPILPLFNQVFLDNFTSFPTYILLNVLPMIISLVQIATILFLIYKL